MDALVAFAILLADLQSKIDNSALYPCAQDPGIPVWFIREVLDPVDLYSPFSIPSGIWLIEAYLQSVKFVALCVRTQSLTDGWTDREI